jgi:hypothetical protein
VKPGDTRTYTPQEISRCIEILADLAGNHEAFAALPKENQIELMKIAGVLSRPDRVTLKQRKKEANRLEREKLTTVERQARAATGIRRAREAEVFTAPPQLAFDGETAPDEQHLHSPRNCYVCKAEFTRLHFFYDSMCPACAELNYRKRFQTADLSGQVALITGSRLKIGYQATLMLLRAGARVIATTRFPVDSALRFAAEKDFHVWGDRVHVYGLDLRHTPSVEIFCRHVEQTYDRLDILINNAAQTVRRPPVFYSHLLANETTPLSELSPDVRTLLANHAGCIETLNSFAVSERALEAMPAIPGRTPGRGLRESARLSQIPYSHDDDNMLPKRSFRRASLMPICSRLICAPPTAGVLRWEKFRPPK